MKKTHRNVESSVQTKTSAKRSLKSPFRRGSVRDMVYVFLQTPTPVSSFVKYVKSLGADPVDVIKFFRNRDLLDEGNAGWLSLK